MTFRIKRLTRTDETDAKGFYFVLVADNGEVVATSEGYTSKASAASTIAAIQRGAALSAVEDLTHTPADVTRE